VAFLTLDRVTKRFATPQGQHTVLRRIDLQVDEGELVAVIGASGCGKTTLVSIIAGLVAPDGGTVLLDGAPIAGPGPDRGVIFQNYSLLPWLTVEENVQLAVDAVATGRSPEWRRVRARHFVDLVGLAAASHKRPRELSGGMRQRVAVARGLATEPRLLLLDEPLSALDALTRATLQSELAHILATERRTAVLVTNDIDEAVLLADRIVTLAGRDGAVVGRSIAVDLPRPRDRRGLSRRPEYQRIRRALVDELGRERGEAA
jgi:nitrate/nitrite transport system ATP-binding protein